MGPIGGQRGGGRHYMDHIIAWLYAKQEKLYFAPSQPSECGRQCTLNIVHAQTAAQQQSNGTQCCRPFKAVWRAIVSLHLWLNLQSGAESWLV